MNKIKVFVFCCSVCFASKMSSSVSLSCGIVGVPVVESENVRELTNATIVQTSAIPSTSSWIKSLSEKVLYFFLSLKLTVHTHSNLIQSIANRIWLQDSPALSFSLDWVRIMNGTALTRTHIEEWINWSVRLHLTAEWAAPHSLDGPTMSIGSRWTLSRLECAFMFFMVHTHTHSARCMKKTALNQSLWAYVDWCYYYVTMLSLRHFN